MGMSGTGWSSQQEEEGWLKGHLREGQDCQPGSPSALTAPELLCPHPSVLTVSTRTVPEGCGAWRGDPGLRLLFPGCRKGSPSSACALARRRGSGSKVRSRKAWASADRELGTGGCTLYMPTWERAEWVNKG